MEFPYPTESVVLDRSRCAEFLMTTPDLWFAVTPLPGDEFRLTFRKGEVPAYLQEGTRHTTVSLATYVGNREIGRDHDHENRRNVHLVLSDVHIRLILGDGDAPDLYLERQVDRWAISVHPSAGADTIADLDLLDNGPLVIEDSWGRELARVE